jgi:hypothetical protein
MPSPAPGTVILYNDLQPPLEAGTYRAVTTTVVTMPGDPPHELRDEKYFEVDSARFALAATDIAACHPPRNGHGAFQNTLPHVVLRKKTLPWDRALDPSGHIAVPTRPPGDQAPVGLTPWVALLLLDEGEGQFLEAQRLEDVVPADVFARLGAPAGVRCDAVEIDRQLLADLLPSLEELRLLAHARQVATDNRALDAGDGWFSVVMANRLPRPGARHRVCLVSLEERSDLVSPDPPAGGYLGGLVVERIATDGNAVRFRDFAAVAIPHPRPQAARLVVLTSWTFEGGDATFPELMGRLDVGMFGLPGTDGEPRVTDTGHLPLVLHDRWGTEQTVWYRSPLVPHQLERDTLGPYHAADQARRVSPETGTEDITYATAFEVGRLLCAADARATGALMQWRRTDYREGLRKASLDRAAAALTIDPGLTTHLMTAAAPVLAMAALERTAAAAPPRADAAGLQGVRATGLEPDALVDAWALPSRVHAEALLAARPLATEPVRLPRPSVGPVEVDHLAEVRDRLLGDPQ